MILHADGDAFFASVEQAINPSFRGKPLVAGRDRGIAAAVSYEAKKYGITRGMPVYMIKQLCPECIIVSSAYSAYQLFSQKMYEIVKNYSHEIERYSIDEVFAVVNQPEEVLHVIAKRIQQEILTSLDISVSVGVAPTKTLAKIASDHDKPGGCVIIPNSAAAAPYLQKLPVGEIWGVGKRLTKRMNALGICTARDLAQASPLLLQHYFSKNMIATSKELQGTSLIPVDSKEKVAYKSMEKTRTFGPTSDKQYIYSQLICNLEKVWFQMRTFGYSTKSLSIFLKSQSFKRYYGEITFPSATYDIFQMISRVHVEFEKLYQENVLYRTTGINLHDLCDADVLQSSLFEDPQKVARREHLAAGIYDVKQRFGRSSVVSASQLPLLQTQHKIPYWQTKPSLVTLQGMTV